MYVLSLCLPSANGGSLVALSLVMCVSLGLCTDATAHAGGEVLPAAGRVISLSGFLVSGVP